MLQKVGTHRHYVERMLDLLLDPRLPHALPYTAWRLWRYRTLAAGPRINEPLRVNLTIDVEHDYRDPTSAASSHRFLEHYLPWAKARGIRSTLYVQGDQVRPLAELLHAAKEQHELGLHGLHHEVWGRSRWWQYRLGFIGLREDEKRRRLQAAIECFEAVELPRPRAFRAPYLNADHSTLRLLREQQFTTDSSGATYLGSLPLPRQHAGLWQIPVTADPRPIRHGKLALYLDLTLGSIVKMQPEQLAATVTGAIKLQLAQPRQLPPHIVILAHPWEFERTRDVEYTSERNWELLDQTLHRIEQLYPVAWTTMSQLVEDTPEN